MLPSFKLIKNEFYLFFLGKTEFSQQFSPVVTECRSGASVDQRWQKQELDIGPLLHCSKNPLLLLRCFPKLNLQE